MNKCGKTTVAKIHTKPKLCNIPQRDVVKETVTMRINMYFAYSYIKVEV